VSLCEFLMGILKKVNRMVSSWREKKDFFFSLSFFCFSLYAVFQNLSFLLFYFLTKERGGDGKGEKWIYGRS